MVHRDGRLFKVLENGDHINPYAWVSDVSVKNVRLQMCWKKGLAQLPENDEMSGQMTQCYEHAKADTQVKTIDLLLPISSFLHSKTHPTALDNDDNEDDNKTISGDTIAFLETEGNTNWLNGAGFSTDVEDAMQDKLNLEQEALGTSNPPNPLKADTKIEYNGVAMNKSYALSLCQKYRKMPKLTDRLNCVQGVHCFKPQDLIIHASGNGDTGLLVINNPIVSVLCFEEHLFLYVREVIDIRSQSVEDIAQDVLSEDRVAVTFQLVVIKSFLSKLVVLRGEEGEMHFHFLL
jgi:hypothetical protein